VGVADPARLDLDLLRATFARVELARVGRFAFGRAGVAVAAGFMGLVESGEHFVPAASRLK
jgi:hypothetical protein